ncbi:hypothetical protein M0R45_014124 [Rubus argutus]|uniref:Uncharacterized protein n=1 Tax=Rubus argutus TaxID=59490 RepID=A0AAW1XLW3_RUBAR
MILYVIQILSGKSSILLASQIDTQISQTAQVNHPSSAPPNPCSSPPLPPAAPSSLSHQLCSDRSCPSQHLSLFRAGSSSLGAAAPLPLNPKPRLVPTVEPSYCRR